MQWIPSVKKILHCRRRSRYFLNLFFLLLPPKRNKFTSVSKANIKYSFRGNLKKCLISTVAFILHGTKWVLETEVITTSVLQYRDQICRCKLDRWRSKYRIFSQRQRAVKNSICFTDDLPMDGLVGRKRGERRKALPLSHPTDKKISLLRREATQIHRAPASAREGVR